MSGLFSPNFRVLMSLDIPHFDPHDYAMSVLLLINSKDFCWNKCHCGAFNL